MVVPASGCENARKWTLRLDNPSFLRTSAPRSEQPAAMFRPYIRAVASDRKGPSPQKTTRGEDEGHRRLAAKLAHDGVVVPSRAAPPPHLDQADPEDEEQDHCPSELTADLDRTSTHAAQRVRRAAAPVHHTKISSLNRACGPVLVAALAAISIAFADPRPKLSRVRQFLQRSAFDVATAPSADDATLESSKEQLEVAAGSPGGMRASAIRACTPDTWVGRSWRPTRRWNGRRADGLIWRVTATCVACVYAAAGTSRIQEID